MLDFACRNVFLHWQSFSIGKVLALTKFQHRKRVNIGYKNEPQLHLPFLKEEGCSEWSHSNELGKHSQLGALQKILQGSSSLAHIFRTITCHKLKVIHHHALARSFYHNSLLWKMLQLYKSGQFYYFFIVLHFINSHSEHNHRTFSERYVE